MPARALHLNASIRRGKEEGPSCDRSRLHTSRGFLRTCKANLPPAIRSRWTSWHRSITAGRVHMFPLECYPIGGVSRRPGASSVGCSSPAWHCSKRAAALHSMVIDADVIERGSILDSESSTAVMPGPGSATLVDELGDSSARPLRRNAAPTSGYQTQTHAMHHACMHVTSLRARLCWQRHANAVAAACVH